MGSFVKLGFLALLLVVCYGDITIQTNTGGWQKEAMFPDGYYACGAEISYA